MRTKRKANAIAAPTVRIAVKAANRWRKEKRNEALLYETARVGREFVQGLVE